MSWNKNWKLVQEIIGAISAVGTLLIGIATIWITVKVSGLQDYFQSEIRYRNEELISSSQALRNLDRQRSNLQKDIEQKNAELAKIEQDVSSARAALFKTGGEMEKERATLDTRMRAQVYQILDHAGMIDLLNVAVDEVNGKQSNAIEIGKFFSRSVERAETDSGNDFLRPYIKNTKDGLHARCPDIFTKIINLPAELPRPKYDMVKPKSNKPEDIKAALSETKIKNDAEYKAYDASSTARQNAMTAGRDQFYKEERDCLCAALSEDPVRQKMICRSAKIY